MLSSWKEIAHFFGKGVRTVQRWEKTLNLPIRRPPGAPSNVVLARTSDLEAWMHRGLGKAAMDEESPSQEHEKSLSGIALVHELETEVHALILHAGGKLSTAEQPLEGSFSVTDHLRVLLEAIRSAGVAAARSDHGLRKVA